MVEVEEVKDKEDGITSLAMQCSNEGDSVLLFVPLASAMAVILQEGRHCIMVCMDNEKDVLHSRVLAEIEKISEEESAGEVVQVVNLRN